jgi:protein O-GlcNAc transferase
MTAEEKAKQHAERADKMAWIEGNKAAALKEYQTALELCPRLVHAHLRIGQLHFHAEPPELAEALAAFQETVRLAPDWSEGHLWLANTLQRMEKNDDAIAAYKEAIRLAPRDARAYTSLGMSLATMGEYEEAIAAFREGLACKPTYGEIAARMALADALKANGQIAEARRQWRTVARSKATWSYEQDAPEEARALLKRHDS